MQLYWFSWTSICHSVTRWRHKIVTILSSSKISYRLWEPSLVGTKKQRSSVEQIQLTYDRHPLKIRWVCLYTSPKQLCHWRRRTSGYLLIYLRDVTMLIICRLPTSPSQAFNACKHPLRAKGLNTLRNQSYCTFSPVFLDAITSAVTTGGLYPSSLSTSRNGYKPATLVNHAG